MLLDGKEYKMGKFTRKLNKEYNEISAKVEAVDKKGEGYSDELLDEMVDMIVKLFDNQFTADEVNNNWDVSDIIMAFVSPQLEMQDKIDSKIKPYEKKFKKKR